MEEDEFAQNMDNARDLLDDEANRTRNGFQPGGLGDPGAQPEPPRQPPSFRPADNAGGPTQPPSFGIPSDLRRDWNGNPFPRPPQPQQATQPPQQPPLPPQQPPQPPQQPPLPPQQPRQQFIPDPGLQGLPLQGGQPSNQNVMAIRALVPQLAHLSDEYILSQPIDALYRLSREEKQAATQAENSKAAKGLEIRMHANAKKANDNPIFVEGWDNRFSMLHPARFLPGAGVPVTALWLEARKIWGIEGTDPIGNFDVETISCSGCVSPRGWEMLHKPGSPEISIKMFTISNVAHSSTGSRTFSLCGEDGVLVSESWKELTDMADLKLAMRNLLMAAHLAVPWNFSFQVLDGFLQAKKYFETELSGLKKAAILSSFIDYCLQANAALWVREAAFMDSARLTAVWASWWASRELGAKADPEKGANTNSQQQQNNKFKKGGNGNGNNQGWGGQKGWKKQGFNQQQGFHQQQGQQGQQGHLPPLPSHSGMDFNPMIKLSPAVTFFLIPKKYPTALLQ